MAHRSSGLGAHILDLHFGRFAAGLEDLVSVDSPTSFASGSPQKLPLLVVYVDVSSFLGSTSLALTCAPCWSSNAGCCCCELEVI